MATSWQRARLTTISDAPDMDQLNVLPPLRLPIELVKEILGYLTLEDTYSLRLTCRYFDRMILPMLAEQWKPKLASLHVEVTFDNFLDPGQFRFINALTHVPDFVQQIENFLVLIEVSRQRPYPVKAKFKRDEVEESFDHLVRIFQNLQHAPSLKEIGAGRIKIYRYERARARKGLLPPLLEVISHGSEGLEEESMVEFPQEITALILFALKRSGLIHQLFIQDLIRLGNTCHLISANVGLYRYWLR